MKDKILEIKRLQEEARTLVAKGYRLLEDADKLVEEIMECGGNRFVYDGVPYKFEYRTKSCGMSEGGNRY